MTNQEKTQKLLLVEDEPHLAFILKLNLEAEGFQVEHCGDGDSAITSFSSKSPFDAIILDVMLPGKDGFAVAKIIRQTDAKVGILMLTARSGEDDRLSGFASGVDDYITKPFHLQELIARVRRMTERARLYKGEEQPLQGTKIEASGMMLDYSQLLLHCGGKVQPVTKLEADFLKELMSNPGQVVSREHLLEKVWGLRSTTETRTIDNFVVRLRKMIENDPRDPKILVSVRGRGYKLEEPTK
jgi:DNA-binding response OmpR family regulator